MKKLLFTILALFFLCGCSFTKNMDNTPTKRVEEFLRNYQTLSSSVLSDLNNMLFDNDSFTEEQKDTYKDIIKSNYQKLTYEIKDEMIDGDTAVVTTEIEVVDYSAILSASRIYLEEHKEEFSTNNEIDMVKYNDYRLDLLKKANDKIKYTIDFTLTKVSDEWVIDDLTNEIRNKINGTYEK